MARFGGMACRTAIFPFRPPWTFSTDVLPIAFLSLRLFVMGKAGGTVHPGSLANLTQSSLTSQLRLPNISLPEGPWSQNLPEASFDSEAVREAAELLARVETSYL